MSLFKLQPWSERIEHFEKFRTDMLVSLLYDAGITGQHDGNAIIAVLFKRLMQEDK